MSDPRTGVPVRGREIVAWAMFDFANSSYTTVIVSVAFSLFFTRVVAPAGGGDFLWGVSILVANAIVVLGSPIVGALADEAGRKKPFLFASYALCVASTALLVLVGPGDVALAMALFVASNVAFSFGENLVAAFLPELATPATIGRVSGLGWGLGYLGGLASLLLVRPLLRGGFTAANLPALRWVWLATALFFLVAGAPTFLVVRERAARGSRRSLAAHARAGFGRLGETARSLRELRQLARFLTAFCLYTAGLTTVISFAAIYAGTSLGFKSSELVSLFILLQLSAAGGALLFGFVQDRLGARPTIEIALALWIATCVAAWAVRDKPGFWAVALVAGLGIGSLQSASRALVGLLAPAGKEAELFGFWGLAGKAAYAIGPAVFGAISSASGSQRLAILSTAGFFLAGWLALRRVDERAGIGAAAAWRERHGGGSGA